MTANSRSFKPRCWSFALGDRKPMSSFSSSSFSGYQRALDHVGEDPGYEARALAVKGGQTLGLSQPSGSVTTTHRPRITKKSLQLPPLVTQPLLPRIASRSPSSSLLAARGKRWHQSGQPLTDNPHQELIRPVHFPLEARRPGWGVLMTLPQAP
jgi:hypothetical protein